MSGNQIFRAIEPKRNKTDNECIGNSKVGITSIIHSGNNHKQTSLEKPAFAKRYILVYNVLHIVSFSLGDCQFL